MALIRYALYFLGFALLTWMLTQIEIAAPGSLKLHVFANESDTLGTSEFSVIEWTQVAILAVCAALFTWVTVNCYSQRPISILFGGLAGIFAVRELDYFLDNNIADNVWQVIVAIAAALLIAYIYRHWRRFKIAWLRAWPSPGIALLFAGCVVLFTFARMIGHEPLWEALLGDQYQRVVTLATEELIELVGYYLWLAGTIEYTYQARALAFKEPRPAVAKQRQGRRAKSAGRY